MTTLRDAVLWCCRLEIPWTAEDVAVMAGMDVAACKAYLLMLARRGVVSQLGEGSYRAGHPDAVRDYRVERPKSKPGGNGAAYRRAKKTRDDLLVAEAAARRKGCLLPPHTGSSPAKPAQLTISADGALRLGVAADLLGVSSQTLRRWEARRFLAVVRLPSGQRRIPVREVSRLLDLRSPSLQSLV